MAPPRNATGKERLLKDGEFIVSRTDTRGKITYVNREFVEISGFSEAELIGRPHNVVRHQDMPKAAFQDLWTTVQAGRPWTGIVKNRCKNDDYYWVLANVSPLVEDGRIVGFISVRSKPTAADVRTAERVYESIARGERSWVLKEGRVRRNSAWHSLLQRLPQTLRTRAAIATIVLGSIISAVGGAGLLGIQQARIDLESVFAQNIIPIKLLKTTADHYTTQAPLVLQKWTQGVLTPEAAAAAMDDISAMGKAQWAAYRGIVTGHGSIAGIQETEQLLMELDRAYGDAIPRAPLDADPSSGDRTPSPSTLLALTETSAIRLNELVDRQMHQIAQAYGEANDRVAWVRNTIAIGLLSLLGLILTTTHGFFLEVLRPMRELKLQTGEILRGNFSIAVAKQRNDEIGELVDAFKSLYTRQGFDIAEARRQAAESQRLVTALDNVSANVMMTDRTGRIIFLNQALQRLMRSLEPEIRRQAPHFSADSMLGTPLATLYAGEILNPRSRTAAKTTLVLGTRTLEVVATPIVGRDGTTIGAALEWTERTNELRLEHDITRIVTAAAQGDFSQRLGTIDDHAFFATLGAGLNRLLETTQSGLATLESALKALARGDLGHRIDGNFDGTLGDLMTHANTTMHELGALVTTITNVSESILSAAREIALGNSDLANRTEAQSRSIEQTAARTRALTETVRRNAEHARQACQITLQARTSTDSAAEVVARLVDNMSTVGKSSEQITRIVEVIEGIAFQTNILAINAAVEAARAGEHGKGFAVVANEVRNLARRSRDAAKEIHTLVKTSVSEIASGHQLVNSTHESMHETTRAIRDISDLMSGIAQASIEQAQDMSKIDETLYQLDGLTQQNAAMVEQAAAAAQSLDTQAVKLNELIRHFSLGDEHAPGRHATRTAPRGLLTRQAA